MYTILYIYYVFIYIYIMFTIIYFVFIYMYYVYYYIYYVFIYIYIFIYIMYTIMYIYNVFIYIYILCILLYIWWYRWYWPLTNRGFPRTPRSSSPGSSDCGAHPSRYWTSLGAEGMAWNVGKTMINIRWTVWLVVNGWLMLNNDSLIMINQPLTNH